MTPKKNIDINTKVIISTFIGLAALSLILIITSTIIADNKGGTTGASRAKNQEGTQDEDGKTFGDYDSSMLAMIVDVDYNDNLITFLDIDNKEDITLEYGENIDVRDKFDQVVIITQLPLGSIVDVGYMKNENELVRIQVSSQGWEYVGVNNLHIDKASKTMKIAERQYKYTDDILIIDDGEAVSIDDLARQDILTVWGREETIWSITVSKGHGTLRLEDYEEFLGGNITVGYEATRQISDGLTITVREGTYNLTVENEHYSGRKSVTINRNEESIVSLEGLGPGPIDEGKVIFEISPIGADLFINGQLTSYGEPIELAYGNYAIRSSLGGFNTYEGNIEVDKPSMRIGINLPELESQEDISVDITPGEDIESDYDDWDETKPEEEDYIDQDHYIYVQAPVGASVYLNGEFIGITPGRFVKIIGTHVMTFIEEGHETMSYTVEIPDDGLDTYISMPDLVAIN